MNYKLKVDCVSCSKEYLYHLNINGFKSINNNTTTVIVVRDDKPISPCPYCGTINYFKYMSSLHSNKITYIEVPRLLKEEAYD